MLVRVQAYPRFDLFGLLPIDIGQVVALLPEYGVHGVVGGLVLHCPIL